MSTQIGKMRERVRFQRRTPTEAGDGSGVFEGDWATQFTVAAAINHLRGSEPVMAARLSGVQPSIVTVRYDIRMKEVTPAWRLVDARDDMIYNIRAITSRERDDYIDIVCDTGAGTAT